MTTDSEPSPPRSVRPGTLRLGTVSGIDITVQHSWFLIVLVIAVVVQPRLLQVEPSLGNLAYLAGLAFAVLLYLSVLLHEISHALAARAFQMPVTSINLHFLGGATQIDAEAATPWREFVIAVVGPLTSLAIGGVAYLLIPAFDGGLGRFSVAALAGANLIVGVLNLVPGLPLDGGRVLQAIVWGVSSRRHVGVVVAAWGGRVAAVFAVFYPLGLLISGRTPTIVDYLMAFMIGAFLWAGATQALMMATVQTRLPSLQARAAGPAGDRGPRRPAAGGGDPTRAGGERRLTRHRLEPRAGPEGIVNEAAVASTPFDRRPWMPTGDLARRLESGLMLSADLQGEDLLRAMQVTPASEYVLVEPTGSIYGVLVTKDVDNAFRAP